MNLLLIDGNSVGYACHYGTVLTHDGMQTQAVFGLVRTLIEARESHPLYTPLVLWDGRANWRFEECPTYKSNRHSEDPKKEAIRQAYKAQTPYIREILKAMGVKQILCKTHEADDLAGFFVARKKPEDKITLLTSDRDWLQLVRHNVVWKDVKTKNAIGTWNFFEQTHFKTPEAFLDGKCLKGDSSDAIPGVGGIGEKGAPEFLATYGSVQNFFNGVDAGVIKPTKKVHQRLASPDGRKAYQSNYKVMQLLDVAIPKKEDIEMSDSTTKDRQRFINLCGELGFSSFLSNPDAILNQF